MPEPDPATVGLLLVDTGVFVAAADTNEPRHRDCAGLLAAHRGRLATTSPALAETAWLIEDRLGPTAEARFLTLAATGALTVIDLTVDCRQRCVVHRCRNIIAKVSEVDQDAVRSDFWEIFDIPDGIAPGEEATAEAHRRARRFSDTWRPAYPAAVDCLNDGFELLITHLHHPRAHWPRIRHTNLIERTFGESRRRVKVIGRLPGERCALSLLWAVLDRASAGWRGITYTPADTRQLQTIRRDLGLTPPKEPPTTHHHNPRTDTTAAA